MTENLNQVDLMLSRLSNRQLSSDRDTVDLSFLSSDVQTVANRVNLAQAILNRLYTRRGELSELGHPDYGSRLHELIGQINNNRTRNLAELYIRECLAQESRIAEITQVTFDPPSRNLHEVIILKAVIIVRPIGEETNLALTVSLNL